MAGVEIEDIGKRFGRTAAVEGADLAVRDGTFVALLGPSGCGKTTLLRLIAGFETPDAGTIRFGGETVSSPGWALAPERRGVGMVFQSYALWPHMTVAGNVGFALKLRGLARGDRDRKVAQALETVGLVGMERRKPAALSGGQRQRVALARCLAMEPRLILLDEPLANLDAHLRETMQTEFRRFHRQSGTTFFYVTHDQSEAMALADEVAVMESGRIRQVSDPRTLYREPATEMVARFIGNGMVVDGTIAGRRADGTLAIDVLGASVAARGRGSPGARVRLCLRPEHVSLAGDAAGIAATISDVRYQGARSMLTAVTADGTRLHLEHQGQPPAQGEPVRLALADAWVVPEPAA